MTAAALRIVDTAIKAIEDVQEVQVRALKEQLREAERKRDEAAQFVEAQVEEITSLRKKLFEIRGRPITGDLSMKTPVPSSR